MSLRPFVRLCCSAVVLAVAAMAVSSAALAQTCGIYVQSSSVGYDRFTVTWYTDPASIGWVTVYPMDGCSDSVTSNHGGPYHVQGRTLTGLKSNTLYQYRIYAVYDTYPYDCAYDVGTFVTSSAPCEFGVSNVVASATSSSITINWSTATAGVGRIGWRAYGWEPYSYSAPGGGGTSHSRTASSLSAGTQYSYLVQMRCPSGCDGQFETMASGTITTLTNGGGKGKGPLPYQPAIRRLWPNPSTGRASLRVALPSDGRVLIDVFDVNGRHVVNLTDRSYPAGEFQVDWNGRNADGAAVKAGIYMVRVRAGGVDVNQRLFMIGSR